MSGPTKISVTPPLGKRNYRKEYDNYHASPEQKKKRAIERDDTKLVLMQMSA